jgi:hypothetical protein
MYCGFLFIVIVIIVISTSPFIVVVAVLHCIDRQADRGFAAYVFRRVAVHVLGMLEWFIGGVN